MSAIETGLAADSELTTWLRDLVREHPATISILHAGGYPAGRWIVERMNSRTVERVVVTTQAPTCRVDYLRANFSPFYLMANARRIASAEFQRKPNWVLAMNLFAVGSNSAHSICREAGVDPDATEVRWLKVEGEKEGGE